MDVHPGEKRRDRSLPRPAEGAAARTRTRRSRKRALPHPIAGLERAEQEGRLRRALARLDPAKREILLLARFSELKYDRIAEQFGISEGAVKVRVHRAMKDLKAAFLADGTTQLPETAETGEAG